MVSSLLLTLTHNITSKYTIRNNLVGGEDAVHEGSSSKEVFHDYTFAQDRSLVLDGAVGVQNGTEAVTEDVCAVRRLCLCALLEQEESSILAVRCSSRGESSILAVRCSNRGVFAYELRVAEEESVDLLAFFSMQSEEQGSWQILSCQIRNLRRSAVLFFHRSGCVQYA